MSEFDPDAHLILNFVDGSEARMDRHNSALFSFVGDLAMHDHVFVLLDQETNSGTYIFRHNEIFGALAEYMVENSFPMHLNANEVAECDQDAFNRSISQMSQDVETIPDDWLDSGTN